MKVRDCSDLREAVRGGGKLPLRFEAGGTKSPPRETTGYDAEPVAERVDVSALAGVSEYEPSEFTLTAEAATPIAQLREVLNENDQELPFDPLLLDAGSTLGGTVAANASGSGRARHGGVRDFVLAVEFVDGLGRLVRSGSRVVKNAAGFDVPKLFVGSMGTLGCLTQITVKVFPRARHRSTVMINALDLDTLERLLLSLQKSPREYEAVDALCLGGAPESRRRWWSLAVRLGGSDENLERRIDDLEAWARNRASTDHDVERLGAGHGVWNRTNGLAWAAPKRMVVKVPMTMPRWLDLERRQVIFDVDRVFVAGQQLLLSVAPSQLADLAESLEQIGHSGVVLRFPRQGLSDREQLMQALRPMALTTGGELLQRVRSAFDPKNRFFC